MQLKKEIKIMLGCLRRADEDFKLIEDGDKIAVGISGGKDSLAMLYALQLYRRFSKKAFELHGITVSLGMQPFDTRGVKAFCEELSVPYTVIETQIGRIVFDERQEKNPCALCANMRRGALNNGAMAAGCNKTALGHHSGDVVGTFLLSLLYESRLNTFSPKTYLSRSGLTVIRPLIYAEEANLRHAAQGLELPVVASPCPACGQTKRAQMETLLKSLNQYAPGAKGRIMQAISNTEQYGLWNNIDEGREKK
ncbi:MAG: tRNA 2-thiocytidine biosynthesis protein TtcA [Christensenellaceae bacterium]|jgi:hypothetical protein ELI_3066|nr:tRNA 2-thiocytidine biosynthesis protein TtcA [Christensenellaceae bacterium]